MRLVPILLHRAVQRGAGAVLLAIVVALPACSPQPQEPPGRPGTARPAPAGSAVTPAPDPLVYVAVGASETVGVGAADPAREGWPEVLRATALPGARLVNVGVSGATVRGALEAQVPAAVAVRPDVVTVWLAVNDLLAQVPVARYERRLTRLVRALRADGSVEVLVGNVPALWRLPAYRACLAGARAVDVPCLLPFAPSPAQVRSVVGIVNRAIARVVAAEGARLVDLSGRRRLTALVAEDGFHPNTAGHELVAAAFAEALSAATRGRARG